MDAQSLTVLRLSLVEGIGPVTVKLLHAKGLDFLLSAPTRADICSYYGVRTEVAQGIFTALHDDRTVESERELANQHGIAVVTRVCPNYPTILTYLHAPPSVLYVRGDVGVLSTERAIATVGSRNADYGAAELVSSLVEPLVRANCVVVSGGARGIDTLSHRAALDAGGSTVAVLGSGILQPYPRENSALFERIVHSGAVISTFALRVTPRAAHFPARNRVIAGLCQVCVVVQAASKSGALITAQYALDMGKDVLAVPGSIRNTRFEGCNKLIKQGAGLVQSSQDIVDALPVYSRSPASICVEKHSLSEHERPVDPLFRALSGGAKELEELAQVTHSTSETIEERLFEMQLEGLVIQYPSGQWALR